jgi:hypothetical protein
MGNLGTLANLKKKSKTHQVGKDFDYAPFLGPEEPYL